MAIVFDPVVVMNLIFGLAILCLGILVYAKRKNVMGIYVAAGFGLFAESHLITLLGYGTLSAVILPLRALGYIFVIIGLCLHLVRRE
jgi:hypothetical protein